jgi:hypothetical protein
VTRERGDVAVPHRYEIGDYFGYFSFRTLQRTLKGGKIDFQPTSTIAGGRQSLQLLSGFVAGGYTDADPRDDYFNGVSWLIESPAWGKVVLNGVHNYRQAGYAPTVAAPIRRWPALPASMASSLAVTACWRKASLPPSSAIP